MRYYHGFCVQQHVGTPTPIINHMGIDNAWKKKKMLLENGCTKLNESPHLLYNLLTSADARSVQRHSAFYKETPADFPKRSNSMTFRRCQPIVETVESRPSSVPHPYVMRDNNRACKALAFDIAQQNYNCAAPFFKKICQTEPLDLCVRGDYSSNDSSASGGGPQSLANDTNVQLSRKQAHVVRARVINWLKEAVVFAKKSTSFLNLSAELLSVLLRGAWPQLLLLSMAEHGCHFAVSVCQRNDFAATQQPTIAFADSLLRIIDLVHSLELDATTFNLLRQASILKSKHMINPRLNEIHLHILSYIQAHLIAINRTEYYVDVVRLLTILRDIDRDMLQTLLCSQLPNNNVNIFLHEQCMASQ